MIKYIGVCLCVYISMSVIYVNLRAQEITHEEENVFACK